MLAMYDMTMESKILDPQGKVDAGVVLVPNWKNSQERWKIHLPLDEELFEHKRRVRLWIEVVKNAP